MENCIYPNLWYACAGGMAQLPSPNSRVFYFPQGHAEHANGDVDFSGFRRIQSMIPCVVQSVKYLADSDTDEVFARIRLIPVPADDGFFDDDDYGGFRKIVSGAGDGGAGSFAKTLTQSDANNGGGFSVPRFCAETIFPRLDYAAEPPVQTVVARDVHGEAWRFRHIYRGTPRRHLLTTGWSSFVNRKKLVAGDSIVFLRAAEGDLRVGIRRAKPGGIGGLEALTGWKALPEFRRSGATVTAEAVAEAAALAAAGQAFDVAYYPRASAPEFVVRAAVVERAVRVRWRTGIRFKMAFETEDSSRISWFMGTVSAASVEDAGRWPDSPWRMLQVVWDEPELLHNLRRVNPWLVELVSATIRLSPPRKRPRLPSPAATGIQRARHVQLKPFDFELLEYAKPKGCRPALILFGQPILTAEQMLDSNSTESSSSDKVAVIPDQTWSDGDESEDVGVTVRLIVRPPAPTTP